VAHFLISALTGRPITVYGDGKQVRDILYVEDLIEAMIAGAGAARRTPGRIYNVGGGAGNATSLVELLALLARVLDRPVEHRFAPWRAGDQRIYVSDNGRIEAELSWKPRISGEEGIGRLLEWIRDNAATVLPARASALAGQPLSA